MSLLGERELGSALGTLLEQVEGRIFSNLHQQIRNFSLLSCLRVSEPPGELFFCRDRKVLSANVRWLKKWKLTKRSWEAATTVLARKKGVQLKQNFLSPGSGAGEL